MKDKTCETKVFVYGAGNIGKDVLGLAKAFKFNVIAFIDKDINKQKSGYANLPVWSIDELTRKNNTEIIVIVAILNKVIASQVIDRLEHTLSLQYGNTLYFYEDFFKNLVKGMSDEEYYKILYKGYYGEELPDCEYVITEGAELYGINTCEIRSPKVVLSLTSFHKRFSTLHLCIKSLLNQTFKADKVVLYLTKKEAKLVKEYKSISSLQKYGLEISEVDEDLRQHKKYYYAMKEYPNEIIITVDDDAIYHKDLVKNLMKSFEKYPMCVSASVAKQISIVSDIELELYEKWKNQYFPKEAPSMSLMAIGVGGKLHPPNSLHQDALNKDLMRELCFNSEDIWVKAMEVLAGTKVVIIPEYEGKLPGAIFDTQETAVWKHWEENSGTKQKLLENILLTYKVPINSLF